MRVLIEVRGLGEILARQRLIGTFAGGAFSGGVRCFTRTRPACSSDQNAMATKKKSDRRTIAVRDSTGV